MTIKITSTKFVKGVVGNDPILTNGIPHLAFIGRSNVGKSSLINSLTNSKISRTSSKPGSTREINVYLINGEYYLVDLPGYGFAQGSKSSKEKMSDLIESYIFNPNYTQKKIVLIIDANVGMTEKDLSMYEELKESKKDFIVAASKIDKMTQSEYHHKIKELESMVGASILYPFSSKKKKGLDKITEIVFG